MGAAPTDIKAGHQFAERAEKDHRTDDAGAPRLSRLGIERREKIEPLRLHRRKGRQRAAHSGGGIFLVSHQRDDQIHVEQGTVLGELLDERRFERRAALHIHHAAPVEDVRAGVEYLRKPVGVEGMFGDIAVTFHVDDVVMADEQHRTRRLFGGVDARDKRLQFIERTLQRRINQLKMSGVFTKIRKL